MSKTANLSIELIGVNDDMPTLDWVQLINGESDRSMANIIDRAFGSLSKHELYSTTQPQGQANKDVWHEIISIE